MKNILIAGLKEPPGGVENAVLAYTKNFDTSALSTDYVFTCGTVSFENKLSPGNAIYLPSRIRHPIRYRKEIQKIFESKNYDALWCNYSGLTNIDLLKAAKKAGIKKRVLHAHTSKLSWGNFLMKYLVPFFHNKNRKSIHKYATDFWACSKKSAIFMFGEEIGKNSVIIPNSVDTSLFEKNDEAIKVVREEFNIPENALVVGHVGRMCTEKNQTFLLDIFKRITEINSNSRLLFVGDGELKDNILQHAKNIHIDQHVIFTGSRNDVPALLQAMDVFLLPSLTEGFPVTVVEAQAADIPCVVSSEAVVREADITGTIEFISLADCINTWAERTLACAKMICSNGAEKVMAAGYDCKEQAVKLQHFFEGDI